MIKTKHLGMIVIATTSLLFSGCVEQLDTFSQHDRYNNNIARANVSLVSYAYPYYYDRPYYFLDGLYYYGGYYRNGFYHYGDRHFRHGHYYTHGNRYYNGRRYRARNGVYGYYQNRDYYERSRAYRSGQKSVDRGRGYTREVQPVRRHRTSHIGNSRPTIRTRDNYLRRNNIGSRSISQGVRGRARAVR